MKIAKTFKEYMVNPDNYLSIDSIHPEIAHRLPGFMNFGIAEELLLKTVNSAGKPGSFEWSRRLMEVGNEAMTIAENANKDEKEGAFLQASFWYFLARFPSIQNDIAREAYDLHIQAYIKANQYSPYSMESLRIQIADKEGRAFLRLPEGKQKYPVVLLSGGIDTWKSDLEIHSLSETFLKRGMAVLLLDIPGTGECPIVASPDAHQWYLSAIERIKQHPAIDSSSIAFYGLSFGGYWSSRLAFVAPELKAVVNVGGPIHHTFQKKWLKDIPYALKTAIANMIGQKSADEAFFEIMETFSLIHLEPLHKKHYPPILQINGKKDTVVSFQEMDFFDELQVKQDTLIFSNDRHVASRNWKLHEQFAAQWLEKHMTKSRQADLCASDETGIKSKNI